MRTLFATSNSACRSLFFKNCDSDDFLAISRSAWSITRVHAAICCLSMGLATDIGVACALPSLLPFRMADASSMPFKAKSTPSRSTLAGVAVADAMRPPLRLNAASQSPCVARAPATLLPRRSLRDSGLRRGARGTRFEKSARLCLGADTSSHDRQAVTIMLTTTATTRASDGRCPRCVLSGCACSCSFSASLTRAHVSSTFVVLLLLLLSSCCSSSSFFFLRNPQRPGNFKNQFKKGQETSKLVAQEGQVLSAKPSCTEDSSTVYVELVLQLYGLDLLVSSLVLDLVRAHLPVD